MSSSSVLDIEVRRNREIEERARRELVAQATRMLDQIREVETQVQAFNQQHGVVAGRIEFHQFRRLASDSLTSSAAAREYISAIADHADQLRDQLAHRRGLAVAAAFRSFSATRGPRTSDALFASAATPMKPDARRSEAVCLSDDQVRTVKNLIALHCAEDPLAARRCHEFLAAAQRSTPGATAMVSHIEQELRDSLSRQRQADLLRNRVQRLRLELAGLEGAEVDACRRDLTAASDGGRCPAELELRVLSTAKAARTAANRSLAYRVFLDALRERGHQVDIEAGTRAMVDGGLLRVSKADDPTWGSRHTVEISTDRNTGALKAHVTRVDGDVAGAWDDRRVVDRFAAVERSWCEDLNAALAKGASRGIEMSLRAESFVPSQLDPVWSRASRAASVGEAQAQRARALDPDKG